MIRGERARGGGDRVQREVRSILNKLTPTNFAKLSDRLIALELRGLCDLQNLVDEIVLRSQIFIFTELFADLCCKISNGLPSFDAAGSRCTSVHKRVNFRGLLLGACQKELDAVCRGTVCLSHQHRKRLFGCTYLMGHLFNRGYVCADLVRAYLTSFLNGAVQLRPEATECCCKLLGTVGKLLEVSSGGRAWMRQALLQLSSVADALSARSNVRMTGALQVLANRGGSARLRFMILDTLTLPCKDWEPRRKEPGPRPLDAMRLEAAHLLPGDDVNWMAVGPSVESSRSPEAPPGCSISDATYQFWAREHEGPMTGVARNAHGASEGSQRVRNPQNHNPMGCGTALWRGQRQDRTSEDADEWPALGAGASEHDSKERDGPASRTGPRRVRFGDGACGQQPDAPDAVF